jgi:predicted metalloprotease with PDZ domain
MKVSRLLGMICLAICSIESWAAGPNVTISVDVTNAPRKIFHASLKIPATTGDLTLYYPKWIPGEHAPDGPVTDLTGLFFKANGQTLKWRRDLLDGFTIHVEVPNGVTEVQAELDFLSPATFEGGFSAGSSATDKLAVISWNQVLLYPKGWKSDDITYTASLKIPDGWKFGTPLPITSQSGNEIHFAPASLTTLVDSPVITGEFLKVVPLAQDPQTEMDIAADSAAALDAPQAVWDQYRSLVDQAQKLFGAHHYRDYHFLYTLSDHVAHFGLEHHESDDSRVDERALVDDTSRKLAAGLLPHEYVHSWNGKYRRPYNLYQTDFSKMQEGSLLWVYEGMTQYLGNVLAARSGLKNQEQYRDMLAASAANLDYKPGREWRSTEDTAIAASILRGGNPAWANWKRGQDYYQEGELFWLDADTTIRKLTDNKKSLTDFLHIFLAKGGNTGPLIVTYNRDELIADLNQVVKNDWATFIHDRVDAINPHADLAGIEQGGYKLVFTDKPTRSARTIASTGGRRGGIDVWYSIGIRVNNEGNITDVRWNGPADKAQLFPGQKIIAVNGNIFSGEALRTAIKDAKGKTEPIHLILQGDTFVTTADLDYHDGERYPSLVRVDGTPDYLDDITKPLTTPEKAPEEKKDTTN